MSLSLHIARELERVYTSVRAIEPDEEPYTLCGPMRGQSDQDTLPADPVQGRTDGIIATPSSRNQDNIVEEGDLPFTWKKLVLEKEEEHLTMSNSVLDHPCHAFIATSD